MDRDDNKSPGFWQSVGASGPLAYVVVFPLVCLALWIWEGLVWLWNVIVGWFA